MTWLWIASGVVVGLLALFGLIFVVFYLYLKSTYLDVIVRIFQEKPLFVIPRGQPITDAEEIRFASGDGLTLRGLYLRASLPRRCGVILFGLEFGSNRWAAPPYCAFLRKAGFDIFTFEPRNQGESDRQAGYEPLQWVTNFEAHDFQAALAYLRGRDDADPRGVGLFGISKGAGAGLIAALGDPYVLCCVTDGMFATHTTMVPYMRKWIAIYSKQFRLQKSLPTWIYSLVARAALRRIQRVRGCRFPHLERRIARLSPRPLLMIHGGADNYIKPEMAQALFERAGTPKELWLIEGAKHNQSFHVANGEYQRRVLAFFQTHLADENGQAEAETGEQVDASSSRQAAQGESKTQGRADLVSTR